MFQTKVVEKIKTHIMCSVTFLKIRAVYDITWSIYAYFISLKFGIPMQIRGYVDVILQECCRLGAGGTENHHIAIHH